MSHPKSNPVPSPDPSGSSGFNAQTQMGLPEVLQMCCLSRRSGQITFRSGESYGFVYIQQGQVLHALCGTIEGEEAIYTMLVWPGGGFSLDEGILPHKRSITLTWEQLLFEGARRADIGLTPSQNMPEKVITIEPPTTRIQDSQPKLTITRPDAQPQVYDLAQEFTHVGRVAGNEICLPYPSVSSRHCIFILSGSDVVVRDLNSSNGTYVNNEIISESVLKPGDLIQVGVVDIRFEAAVKRPKLIASQSIPLVKQTGQLKKASTTGAIYFQSVPLPETKKSPTPPLKVRQAKDNSAYVKGESAISYQDLAVPEQPKKKAFPLILMTTVVFLLIAAGAYYYFFVMHQGLR